MTMKILMTMDIIWLTWIQASAPENLWCRAFPERVRNQTAVERKALRRMNGSETWRLNTCDARGATLGSNCGRIVISIQLIGLSISVNASRLWVWSLSASVCPSRRIWKQYVQYHLFISIRLTLLCLPSHLVFDRSPLFFNQALLHSDWAKRSQYRLHPSHSLNLVPIISLGMRSLHSPTFPCGNLRNSRTGLGILGSPR